MELDLRRNGKLATKFAEEINSLEPIVRAEYNDYIGELAEINNINNLGWLAEVTCRNTFASQIHNQMCRLALLESQLKQRNPVTSILVDDDSMYASVVELLKKYGQFLPITISGIKRFRNSQIFYNFFKTIYMCFNNWVWPKVIAGREKPKGKIIYLENFLFLDSFDSSDNFKDRNYPGFIENLNLNQRSRVWYVPSILGLKLPHHWIQILRSINKSSSQFLLKEDYLSIKDYFYAIYNSFVIPKNIRHIPKWRDIDISKIVKDEALVEIGSYSLVYVVLYYRFIKRIKDCGIEMEFVVDWNENQTLDRALNLGMKKFFPNTLTKGYQGFVINDYYASLTPTCYERDHGLLPDQIYVISQLLVNRRLEYCKDLNVSLAPAFRYQKAIDYNSKPNLKRKAILIALPMLHTESQQLLNLVLNANIESDVNIIIKRHPTVLMNTLLRNVAEANNTRLIYTEKNLIDVMDEATLFVTMTSSAGIEAILCNTYVAIIANSSAPTANPLQDIVDPKFWSLCYTPENIKKAFNHALNNKFLNKIDYLVPLTKKTFSNFIDYH